MLAWVISNSPLHQIKSHLSGEPYFFTIDPFFQRSRHVSVIRFQKLGGLIGGLALALGLLFSGCGGGDQDEPKPPQNAEAKQKFEDKIKEAAKSGLYGKKVNPPK
jgi:hypothetical protein